MGVPLQPLAVAPLKSAFTLWQAEGGPGLFVGCDLPPREGDLLPRGGGVPSAPVAGESYTGSTHTLGRHGALQCEMIEPSDSLERAS